MTKLQLFNLSVVAWMTRMAVLIVLAGQWPAAAWAQTDAMWARPCQDGSVAECLDPLQGYRILHDFNTRGQISSQGPQTCVLEHATDTFPAEVRCVTLRHGEPPSENSIFFFEPVDWENEPADVVNWIKTYRTDWKQQFARDDYFRITSAYASRLEAGLGTPMILRVRNEQPGVAEQAYLEMTKEFRGNDNVARAGGIFWLGHHPDTDQWNVVRIVEGLFCGIADDPCRADAPLSNEHHLVTHWGGNRVLGYDGSGRFYPNEDFAFRIVPVAGARLPEAVDDVATIKSGALSGIPLRLTLVSTPSACFPETYTKGESCTALLTKTKQGSETWITSKGPSDPVTVALSFAAGAPELPLELHDIGGASDQAFLLIAGEGGLKLASSAGSAIDLSVTINDDSTVSFGLPGGGFLCRTGQTAVGRCDRAATFRLSK